MRTLDKVIEALELCVDSDKTECKTCKYYDGYGCFVWNTIKPEALQYLREYQRAKNYADVLEVKEQKQNNKTEDSPLSWEELENMVGKKVWIEIHPPKKYINSPFLNRWIWVKVVSKKELKAVDGGEFLKKNKGVSWEVFRDDKNRRNSW